MRQITMRASLALLLCVTSSACAPSSPLAEPTVIRLPPEIRTVHEYPTIPGGNLSCSDEPGVPAAKTDIELALWAQALREAGADCRAKLDAIRELVATWGRDG